MSRARLILKFNWSTLCAGESESDSNMIKYVLFFYFKEMILKMLRQGPRWQFPGPGRFNGEVGEWRQTTSSGWTSSSDCRGWDNAGETKTNTTIDTNTNTKTIKGRNTKRPLKVLQTVVAQPLQNNLKLITSLWTDEEMANLINFSFICKISLCKNIFALSVFLPHYLLDVGSQIPPQSLCWAT